MIALIIFLLSLHIQLIYFILVFGRLISFKEKKEKSVQNGVTVIVAAHNELFNLKNLLPQLLLQEYENYEILIVNDRSSDGTEEYLRQNFSTEDKIRIVNIIDFDPLYDPKKYAITTAVRLASHDIILLTDADCIPRSRKWISEMVAGYTGKTEIVLGYSPYFKKAGILNSLIRYETFYTAVQYLGLALSGAAYMGVGRNLSYTKRLFMAKKGFVPVEYVTGGDDDLFIQKAANEDNVNIVINENAHTVSLPKDTLQGWLTQKKRHLSVGKYYKSNIRFLLGLLAASHLGFYVCFFIILFQQHFEIIGWIGFALRTILLICIFVIISKRLKEKFTGISLPLFDFLFILSYCWIGITAVVSRKTTWK